VERGRRGKGESGWERKNREEEGKLIKKAVVWTTGGSYKQGGEKTGMINTWGKTMQGTKGEGEEGR